MGQKIKGCDNCGSTAESCSTCKVGRTEDTEGSADYIPTGWTLETKENKPKYIMEQVPGVVVMDTQPCEFCRSESGKPNTHHKDCPSLIGLSVSKGVNPKDAIGAAKNPHGCVSRAVLAEVGLAMMEGARKYRRHNYRVSSVRAEVYFDAVNRHLDAWWEGEDIDPDSGLPHLTKAIASLFVIRDAIICNSWYDDRPPKVPESFWAYIKERTAGLLKKFPESKPPYTEKGEQK